MTIRRKAAVGDKIRDGIERGSKVSSADPMERARSRVQLHKSSRFPRDIILFNPE